MQINKTIKITPEKLIEASKAFDEDVVNQAEALLRLYRFVFGQELWDKITRVGGFPSTSKNISLRLVDKFVALDKKYHPNCMAGGIWLNNGFSTNSELPDNTIMINLNVRTEEEEEANV